MPGSSPMQGDGRIAVESNGGGGGGPRSGSIAALAAADRRAVETAGVSSREVSHATWHVGASPAPHVAVQDASAHLEGSARTMESPYRGVARAHRLGEKKPSFNMRGLLKSVSSHSFKRYPHHHTREGSPTPERKSVAGYAAKGWLLEKQGKLHEAELMYSRHCLRSQKTHGKESLPLAGDLDRLVNLLHKEGKLEEAEPLCRRSLEIKRKSLGEESEEVATSFVKLGRVLEDKGQYENALVFLKKGLAIREKIRPPGHPDIMSALAWIGDIHCRRDEHEEALTIAKKVAAAHEAADGPDDIKVASALNNVAGLLATLGRPQEALPLFTRSEDIYSRHLGAQHPHTVAAHLWIQQLSTPQPAARVRRRVLPPALSTVSRGACCASTGAHPPPLVEEDEASGSGATVGVTPDTAVRPALADASVQPPAPPSAEVES